MPNFPFLKQETFNLRVQETFIGNKCEMFIPSYFFNKSNPDIAIAKELGDRVQTMGLFWFLIDGKDWYELQLPLRFEFQFTEADKRKLKIRPNLPEDTYNDCENTQLYTKFKRNGHLIITPGNVCDYDYICNLIHEINNVCPVQNIYYDAYNSTQFIIQLTEHGFQCSPYSQSLGAYNKPTKEFERRVLSNNVKIDYNDCVLWCFQNTTLKYDHNDNCKPVKGASRKNKIDAVISMLTALGGMLQDPTYSNEIWVC